MIPTLRKLNKTAIALLENIELQPLYEAIIKEGCKLVDSRYGTIYLESKDMLERVYSTVPQNLQVQIRKNGFTYKAFKTKKVRFISIEKISPIHREIRDFDVKSVILIPICYRDKCFGVISLDSYKHEIEEKELVALDLFGSMATLAINQSTQYEKMIAAVEQRDLLISLTAHEFRTPLTTINGYAQLLIRKLQNAPVAIKEYVNELYSETNRLISLTNDLLDMSRMRTGKMVYSLEECYIGDILERAITRFKFAFPNHKLYYSITQKDKSHFIADFDKLLQVFTNILDNAGKFTPPEKGITLTLERLSKHWMITITDTGRGISPNDQSKIFTGFYKGKNSDETQGMGLGLFIAKSIIDAHQGKISVHSEIGAGTTFTITLPHIRYAP
jgi:signal transduction histidine kinase